MLTKQAQEYYELYATDVHPRQPEIESIKSCGVTFAIDGLLNELGLVDIMRKTFPKHADQIIALA